MRVGGPGITPPVKAGFGRIGITSPDAHHQCLKRMSSTYRVRDHHPERKIYGWLGVAFLSVSTVWLVWWWSRSFSPSLSPFFVSLYPSLSLVLR